MEQVSEEELMGEDRIVFAETLLRSWYQSSVAVDCRRYPDLAEVFVQNRLMRSFVNLFDSVVYRP